MVKNCPQLHDIWTRFHVSVIVSIPGRFRVSMSQLEVRVVFMRSWDLMRVLLRRGMIFLVVGVKQILMVMKLMLTFMHHLFLLYILWLLNGSCQLVVIFNIGHFVHSAHSFGQAYLHIESIVLLICLNIISLFLLVIFLRLWSLFRATGLFKLNTDAPIPWRGWSSVDFRRFPGWSVGMRLSSQGLEFRSLNNTDVIIWWPLPLFGSSWLFACRVLY